MSEELNFRLPRWNELPELELYLEQVVAVLKEYLEPFYIDKDEKIITKTMINNYVKFGVIKPPINKKYNKSHIAYLIVVCLVKKLYSIQDIKALIRLALGVSRIESSYDMFCTMLEKHIECTFANIAYIDEEELGRGRRLVKNVAGSLASKLYVEKNFLNK